MILVEKDESTCLDHQQVPLKAALISNPLYVANIRESLLHVNVI